jgi:hypothetical protein
MSARDTRLRRQVAIKTISAYSHPARHSMNLRQQPDRPDQPDQPDEPASPNQPDKT